MIGKIVSHYKILEELGRGGMGEVYLAEDTKLERKVALKFLPAQFSADEDEKKRFVHEAKAASALDHPNICSIYEIGETPEGRLFIAMGYYAGKTLKERIKEGPLPVPEAVGIAVQVAEGLAAAHAKGVVHRDIKSDNIMITTRGQAKIMDFGLAKWKGSAKRTRAHSTLGTLSYMSPEQARGEEVDLRSDIFSLGAVLYEMITGHRPFKDEYEAAIIYSILNETPEPLARYKSNVPDGMQRIVDKALAKEREKRYQHADEMATDLRSAAANLSGSGGSARRRSRLPWAAAAVALALAVILLLLFYPKPAPQPAIGKSIAMLPFKNLSDSKEDEYFSDGLTEDIITQLAKIGDLKVISRTSVMQYKNFTRNIREIGRELDVGTVLEGSVRRSGDRIRITSQLIDAETDQHLWAETYDREIQDVFAIQSDVAKQIALALKINISPEIKARIVKKQTENTEAYQLVLKGRFFWNKRTAADLKKAIAYFNQAIEKDPSYAQAYAGLSNAYVAMLLYEFTRGDYKRKSQQAAAKALELDPTLGEAYCVLGSIQHSNFDWKNAEMHFQRAIELDPNYPTTHHWYSQLLNDLGRSNDALSEAKRALELDPLSLSVCFGAGLIFFQMKRYDEAVDLSSRGIELDPSFPWSYYVRGLVAEARGKLDEATRDYHKARLLAHDDPGLLGDIGRACARMGRKDDALKALRELRDFHEKGYLVSFAIANVYLGLGDKASTFAWLERSLDDHESMITDIITYPAWDGLRSEPRFIALLKKMGLPQ